MRRAVALVYGVFGFLLFHVSLLYFIGFLANLSFLPKTLDTGEETSVWVAVLINTTLIALFGLQHSIMARPKFKQWWAKYLPVAIERSTYVVLASLILLLLAWQWRPLPGVVWQVTTPTGYWFWVGLFYFGWIFSTFAAGLIDLFDLMGLRQVYFHWRNLPYTPPEFKIVSIYRYIRHPIMLGTLLGLWATPTMTVGHLLLAIGLTLYIFIGIAYEEKDMVDLLGEKYLEYKKRTNKISPL